MKSTTDILDTVAPGTYKDQQQVQLIIKAKTDLGYKAIVDEKYWGVLYFNEVFTDLEKNQELTGYIKKIREDGKIDLSLYPIGTSGARNIGEEILEFLKAAGGSAELTDKTDPEIIYRRFGVSKKKFKIALGSLYKKRLITISEDQIHLTESQRSSPAPKRK